MVNDQGFERTGWVVSIGIHILIAVAFVLMQFELKPFDLDFTPIRFAPLTELESGGGERTRSMGGSRPMVELPKRPMIAETSPLLKLPDSDRRAVIAPSTSGKPDLSGMEALRPGRRSTLLKEAPLSRERAPVKPLRLSDESLFGEPDDRVGEAIAAEEMFTIRWEGTSRVKLAGELPEFPMRLNRAATVRLRFTVAPDGSVGLVTPDTKGLPELERVSIEAMKTWRFNQLDPSIAQKNQSGVITFKFELK